MALSVKQKAAAQKQFRLAEKGESRAVQFFENVKAHSPALHAEYMEYLQGGDGNVGVKRADLKGVDTKIMSNKQFQVAVKMSKLHKAGSQEGVKFMASQETEAAKGSKLGRTYLDVCKAIADLSDEEANALLASEAPKPAANVLAPQQAPVEHAGVKPGV